MSVNFAAALDEAENEVVEIPEQAPEVLPPAGPVLSLDAVKPQFSPYMARTEQMVADAKAVAITDEESLKLAVALGAEASRIAKLIDAKRKEVTAEANDYVKSVNGFCKLFTEKLDAVVRTLKAKIGQYQAKIELERRETEKKAQEATRKLQEDINKEAEAKGVEPVQVAPPTIPKEETIVRTETGATAYQQKQWTFEIVDPALVPRNACSPDPKKIREMIKAGVRTLPGVRIYEEPITKFRT